MEFGIMQGRLSPRQYPKLQAFPHESWKDEFYLAAELGISHIEWIFELDRYELNPLWSETGRKEILRLVNETGVQVHSVCADYFLEMPMHRGNSQSLKILKELIPKASEIGNGKTLILLPVLEEAEICSPDEKTRLISAVCECLDILSGNNARLGLEMEVAAHDYLEFTKSFGSERVGAYYDTGNSASKGFDMKKDLDVLLSVLFGVHLKDRLVNSGSTYLGMGATNFKEGLPFLREHGFRGTFIVQSFYENDPIGTMRRNIELIKGFWGGI